MPEAGSSVPDPDDPNVMDFHRMVWGVSYAFNDHIILHTEVDFEHSATEIELEFAYLDFLINEAFNVRAGSMLMPLGPLNEFHEPTLYYSVERPYVQNVLIPTTWQEGGVGIFGSPMPGLKYRTYVVSSLNAEGFTASSGIRGGRGHAAEAPSEDLAWVGRLEYVGVPGLQAGGSVYTGGANATHNPALDEAGVTLLEADARYHIAGFEIQGIFVHTTLDGADAISTEVGQTIGSEQMGWMAEAAYHVLHTLSPDSEQDVVIFLRREEFNTQEEVETGFSPDPANDRQVTTVGLAYFPHENVAVKVDREGWENEADADEERYNVGLAYMF
jgi:hypothetical protein